MNRLNSFFRGYRKVVPEIARYYGITLDELLTLK